MNLNYKQLGMYLLVGIASGFLCLLTWYLQERFNGHRLWFFVGPGFVLGVMILLAGRYISGIGPRHLWFSPLILILFCGIGWYLAVEHGAAQSPALATSLLRDLFSHVSYMWEVESGVIGGLFVGTGLAFAWKLKSAWVVILLATAAGGLGGVVLRLLGGEMFGLLFVYWQGMVLLGIGVAVQINSNKSSIKQ